SSDCYDQLAIFRMDHHVSECAIVQGDGGPADRPGAHHRYRQRVVPVAANTGEEQRRKAMRQGERQWFQARLRWAVMEEGRGLDHWLEAEHIFQSDSRE